MVGIIVAMEIEKDAIKALIENVEETQYYNRVFYTGKISGQDVVVMKGGVGKVAAGIATAQMIEQYHPDSIINIGCAGGTQKDEHVLDMVVSKRLTYHDFDTTSIDGSEVSFDNDAGYIFYSDEKLSKIAVEAFNEVSDANVFVGDIVSGDCFVVYGPKQQFICDHFPSAVACEMEATSVAHACSEYHVPFICIRSLSDIVVNEGNGMDFMKFAQLASERSAKFCSKFLEKY